MKFDCVFLGYICIILNVFSIQSQSNSYKKDSLDVVSLLNEGYAYEKSNPEKAIATYKKAVIKSKAIGFNLGSFRANSYTAIMFSDLAIYDSAIFYNKKALPFAKHINYNKGIAATYVNLGNIYQFFGQLTKVDDNYFKAIEIFESTGDSINVSKTYQNLAAFYSTFNNHENEIKYLTLALKANSKKARVQNGLIYGDLGLNKLRQGEKNKALEYFKKADSISEGIDDEHLSFYVAYHYGEYFLNINKYLKAIEFYEKALTINANYTDVYYKAEVLLRLGQTNSKLKKDKSTTSYLQQALKLAIANNMPEIEAKVYEELALINERKQDFKTAYHYKALSIKLSDSLKSERLINRVNYLETQFEFQKKNSEINVQKLEIVQQRNSIQRQQMNTNYAIATAILFLILTVAIWLFYKQRQKRKNQELIALKSEAQVNALESLIEGEEKERLRIAKELHDGVNGDLSAIKHKLNTLLEMNNTTIKEAVVMIDKSCEQVRAISHNLVPPALENFDLQTAAADYVTNMNAIHKSKISFDFIGIHLMLPKIIEVNIFRIIQELVTNSIKHSNANEIHVQLSSQDDNIQLSVDDDGVGFDVNTKEGHGVGLSNIKNRVSFLNGEINISSSDLGTSVNIFMDKTKFNAN